MTNHTTQPLSRLSAALLGLGFLASFMLSFIMLTSQAAAANITMLLASSAANVQQGGIFTVDVRVEAGSASLLDAIARVNYNASQLSLESASYSPSASWGEEGPDAGSGTGYYTVDVVSEGTYPSGSIHLARLTFKALAASGSSALSLTNASAGDGSDPFATHTVAVQGVSIGLQAPPSADQPANPGTAVPASGTTTKPKAGTPTDPNTNQGTPITDEAALAAATTESEQAAETVAAEIAANTVASTTSNKKKVSLPLLIGLATVVLVAVGALVIQRVLSSRSAGTVAYGGTPVVGDMQTPSASINTPAGGEVISPSGDGQDRQF